ncbi:beta subunit of fatty acid synthetase [Coemansia guatemalensis]|uniref:Beta subunit of fatty acid synthetase n=1 Tax=Coemansia guatemalensis TaxID=2761395 RepID=A0A9W8HTR3_9FUNG|nr:beta subunit of fatty acid synthetase [Coemansia guatemalensis]
MGPNVDVSLTHGSAVVSIVAPAELAQRLQPLVDSFSINKSSAITSIELHTKLLEHCATRDQDAALVVLEAFCQKYDIPATDIHIVVQQQNLDEDAAQLVLRAYFLLWEVAAARRCYRSSKHTPLPALFATDSLRLTAMFGGQPGSSNYLVEARWLLDVYRPLLSDYVARMAAFLKCQARDARLEPVYKKGLDVLQWLAQPESAPDTEYLVSAPVSMPLTGLVQLMQIIVLHKTLGVSPGDLARHFNGKKTPSTSANPPFA